VTAMEQLYQQLILDHAREKHGFGLVEGAGEGTGESFQVNPVCGDEVRLRVTTGGEPSTIAQVSWEGTGCSISQASTSMLVDLVSGSTPERAREIGEVFTAMMHSRGVGEDDERLGDAAALHGVARYPARVKCALLGWMALQDALIRAAARTDEGE